MDVALDEGTDLPAHEVGEGEEESERDGGVGLAGEVDGEDKTQNDDEADECSPGRRGGDAEGGDEEAERGDGKHLGEQGGGLLAGYVDDAGVGVRVVVVQCHGSLLRRSWMPEGYGSNTMRRFSGQFVMFGCSVGRPPMPPTFPTIL